jgi:hypothetical protein
VHATFEKTVEPVSTRGVAARGLTCSTRSKRQRMCARRLANVAKKKKKVLEFLRTTIYIPDAL